MSRSRSPARLTARLTLCASNPLRLRQTHVCSGRANLPSKERLGYPGTPSNLRALPVSGPTVGCAQDSPLEQSGFELRVPPACDAPGSHKVRC